MRKLSFMSLERQTDALSAEILSAVREVCENRDFTGGKHVEEFERAFAAWLGLPGFVGASSGTASLLLALRACRVQSGNEVIVPANTFIATAWAPVYLGAKPVFADCDPFTWEIDPADVERKITPNTKAIIGVHLYGQAFPAAEILSIARAGGLHLVEDCAQAQGTICQGRRAGQWGDAACYSFYPSKNLGACGDAGGLSLADEQSERLVRRLRTHGSERRYYHDEVGYNMRMGGFQAAILLKKLPYLEEWNNQRAHIYRLYRTHIRNPRIVFQAERPDTKPAWHLAVCCVDDREKFLSHMEDAGIDCGIHYPIPCHLQKAFSYLDYREGDFPHTEYLASHCVSLPLFPELTESEISLVIDVCNRYG